MKKVIEYRILETNFNRKNQQIKIRTEKKTDARRRTRRGAEELSPLLRWASNVPLADASLALCCWAAGRHAAYKQLGKLRATLRPLGNMK